jgi:hypothetical protein
MSQRQHDKVTGKVLKYCHSSLAFIIHHICQLSLNSGVYPEAWKIGEIIPVPKKDTPLTDNDFRPVALTSLLSKCYERILKKVLLPYVTDKIDNLQFAYLANRSTDDAINTLLHFISGHLDKAIPTYVRSLFIDYSSAFNTIQPHIMIPKLVNLGVPSQLCILMMDFLTNRKQFVRTRNQTSSLIDVNTGAPQGCVLSPILFVLYTNDLRRNDSTCKIIKYADDTVVLGLVSENNEDEYRGCIRDVAEWCNNNFLDLNVNKTKEVVFDFRRNPPAMNNVHINNREVETVSEYKYLGCTIDKHLNFVEHINGQVKKANKRLFFVRMLKKFGVNPSIIARFYDSTISTVLMYASSGFFNLVTNKMRQKLNKPRRTIVKITKYSNHIRIPDHQSMYNRKLRSMTKTIMDDVTHPLHDYFQYLPSNRRLRTLASRTNRFKNSFAPSAIRYHNFSSQR